MPEIIKTERPVYILSSAAVGGQNEFDGPLGNALDMHDPLEDDTFGCDTWEKSESEMQRLALSMALSYALKKDTDIDMLFAGDLLNQCAGSNYGLVTFQTPYLGLYGACSTAAEGLLLASLMCGSAVRRCAAVTSSHNASSERQFRFPLEYGGQRTPTAQWTVTGAAGFVLSSNKADLEALPKEAGPCPVIRDVLPGIAIDKGVNDPNNMGAAMAPEDVKIRP